MKMIFSLFVIYYVLLLSIYVKAEEINYERSPNLLIRIDTNSSDTKAFAKVIEELQNSTIIKASNFPKSYPEMNMVIIKAKQNELAGTDTQDLENEIKNLENINGVTVLNNPTIKIAY